MAHTRHFWCIKALLLVAGLSAVRPGDEEAAILDSQIYLCFALKQPVVTQQTGKGGRKWPGALPMAHTRHFIRCIKTLLLVAGLSAVRPGDEEAAIPAVTQQTGRGGGAQKAAWCSPHGAYTPLLVHENPVAGRWLKCRAPWR